MNTIQGNNRLQSSFFTAEDIDMGGNGNTIQENERLEYSFITEEDIDMDDKGETWKRICQTLNMQNLMMKKHVLEFRKKWGTSLSNKIRRTKRTSEILSSDRLQLSTESVLSSTDQSDDVQEKKSDEPESTTSFFSSSTSPSSESGIEDDHLEPNKMISIKEKLKLKTHAAKGESATNLSNKSNPKDTTVSMSTSRLTLRLKNRLHDSLPQANLTKTVNGLHNRMHFYVGFDDTLSSNSEVGYEVLPKHRERTSFNKVPMASSSPANSLSDGSDEVLSVKSSSSFLEHSTLPSSISFSDDTSDISNEVLKRERETLLMEIAQPREEEGLYLTLLKAQLGRDIRLCSEMFFNLLISVHWKLNLRNRC
ncbi:uncharacterized protein LOC126821796 isoform X2 [Patella vulgata]|uniref:uncharacterized protein LOC126821796 isoform X2 n=1 Tax=Patella vulgata TaxID=6465 RepID=UPI0021808797|nr:uncharacterized protein LOC126821796 isoform X2 [Patella vulgata]